MMLSHASLRLDACSNCQGGMAKRICGCKVCPCGMTDSSGCWELGH